MSRPGKYRKFRSVGSVLPRVLRQFKLDKVLAAQPAVTLWPEIAGPKTAEHTRALEVDGNTSSSWLTARPGLPSSVPEAATAEEDFRARGQGLVLDLRFVLGQGKGNSEE